MSLPTESRCWLSDLDGISNLRQDSVPIPSLHPTQILVKIHAVALNYKDGETVEGLFKHHKTNTSPVPLIPTSDCVGTVVGTGSAITSWKEGDRVISLWCPTHKTGQITPEDIGRGLGGGQHGTLSQYRVFGEEEVVRAPKKEVWSDAEACTVTIAGVTAWMAINQFQPLGQNIEAERDGKKNILVLGTGGVSLWGAQIAKASGMNVIVTSSSDEKLERAKKLGADHLINYRTHPNWEEQVMTLTSGHGADIILENGGAYTTSKSMSCVAFGGLISSIGYVSGKVDPEDADRTNINVKALMRNFTLKGLLNGPKDRLEELVAFCAKKNVKPVVDKVFGFDQGKDALQYLWDGKHFGKVVIKVSD